MGEKILFILLLLLFIGGSVYNFKVRLDCAYPVRITKPRLILIIIIPLVFFVIAYVGGNTLSNYLLVMAASLLLISAIVGEGIHEKGIYYYSGKRLLAKLAKWEDLKEIETDGEKIKSFKHKKMTRYPDQYYRSEELYEIKQYIKERRP